MSKNRSSRLAMRDPYNNSTAKITQIQRLNLLDAAGIFGESPRTLKGLDMAHNGPSIGRGTGVATQLGGKFNAPIAEFLELSDERRSALNQEAPAACGGTTAISDAEAFSRCLRAICEGNHRTATPFHAHKPDFFTAVRGQKDALLQAFPHTSGLRYHVAKALASLPDFCKNEPPALPAPVANPLTAQVTAAVTAAAIAAAVAPAASGCAQEATARNAPAFWTLMGGSAAALVVARFAANRMAFGATWAWSLVSAPIRFQQEAAVKGPVI